MQHPATALDAAMQRQEVTAGVTSAQFVPAIYELAHGSVIGRIDA